MDAGLLPNQQQAINWNGEAGQAWVEAQEVIDSLLAPIEDLLADAVCEAGPSSVLDIGCGTGATTLAFARRITPGGSALGIDISEPMVAAARARAEATGLPARFVVADAATHAFTPARFDMLASRFGVMFFDDPIGAFANLRSSARPGAGLRLVVWRAAEDNPFMTAAERAAAPLLPEMPPRDPDAPGQFAFADRRRVQRILEQAGWDDVEIRPLDVSCAMPAAKLETYFTRLGPVARALGPLDAERRATVVDAVRAGFAPFVDGAEVRFVAACWLVSASVR